MRRPLASAVAAALLASPALARAGEPLDLDLARLGAPDPAVWQQLATNQGAPLSLSDAKALARDAKVRFGLLSIDTALALSAALLQPGSTTGHSGFDMELEGSYVGVHPTAVSSTTATIPGWTAPATNWPTRSMTPYELFMPSFHVRKALPFSFELGGRVMYLSQSSYFAGQVEGKWALNEGFDVLPDLAVRLAWTQLFGQRDWNLGSGDVDVIVSKRWGVNAVTSFTPYVAARFTFVRASSDPIAFAPAAPPDPSNPGATVHNAAEFPDLNAGFYRTTFGVRMTAYAVSMAAEGTWFTGSHYSGKGDPAADEYPSFNVKSSFGGAFKFGFEF